MTLKSYLWGIRIATFFAVIAFGGVVYYTNPENSGLAGKILFYLVIFFAISGIFNLVLLRMRRSITGQEAVFANVGLSFRQGSLLSVFAVGLLILQSMRALVWWDGLLLLAGIFLVELYFLSRK